MSLRTVVRFGLAFSIVALGGLFYVLHEERTPDNPSPAKIADQAAVAPTTSGGTAPSGAAAPARGIASIPSAPSENKLFPGEPEHYGFESTAERISMREIPEGEGKVLRVQVFRADFAWPFVRTEEHLVRSGANSELVRKSKRTMVANQFLVMLTADAHTGTVIQTLKEAGFSARSIGRHGLVVQFAPEKAEHYGEYSEKISGTPGVARVDPDLLVSN